MISRFALTALSTIAFAAPGLAADHQVKMVNKDSEGHVMQFEPAFLKIARETPSRSSPPIRAMTRSQSRTAFLKARRAGKAK